MKFRIKKRKNIFVRSTMPVVLVTWQIFDEAEFDGITIGLRMKQVRSFVLKKEKELCRGKFSFLINED